jgi:hypothetical protein
MPCKKLENLDKRYRKRYAMSVVENLKDIQTNGIENFLRPKKRSINAQTSVMFSRFTTENATRARKP